MEVEERPRRSRSTRDERCKVRTFVAGSVKNRRLRPVRLLASSGLEQKSETGIKYVSGNCDNNRH